jgi:hypothetical protein
MVTNNPVILLDIGKFIGEVENNQSETNKLIDGVIPYFNTQGYKLYFKSCNPFELLKVDPTSLASSYNNSYQEIIQSSDYTKRRTVAAVEYLISELPNNPVRSPICLNFFKEKYVVYKGNKKLTAMAILGIHKHPIIISSSTKMEEDEITSDAHLFEILNVIDPSASKFYFRIEDFGAGLGFHFLTKHTEVLEWVPAFIANSN